MNIKENNLHKIIAAAALGLILIFLIVIATSGKNQNNDNNSGEFDEIIDNTDKLSGDTDRNTDGTADTITNNENESTGSTENDTKQEQPPKFTSALTGLECSEEVYSLIPFAFVTDPDEPLYGISYSEITVEIPLENGKTRLLIYISDEHNLGKIGTILPTRSYITGITELIPGVIVAYGDDGIKDHTSKSESVSIDLKENFGYAYMENGKCVYTDTQTILAFAKLEDIDKTNHQTVAAPFEFCNFGDFIVGKNEANKIEIPYSSSAPTSLIYESESKEYVLSKSCKSSIPSPTPMSLTGIFCSCDMARTIPPLALPSSFVRIIPVISAIFASTKFVCFGSLRSPLNGAGQRYGASVSIKISFKSIPCKVSTIFFAFLKVQTPPKPSLKPRLINCLATSKLPLKQ